MISLVWFLIRFGIVMLGFVVWWLFYFWAWGLGDAWHGDLFADLWFRLGLFCDLGLFLGFALFDFGVFEFWFGLLAFGFVCLCFYGFSWL